ncbi:MAG: translation initiation inhibitor [Opitutaceae bacterium]|jgi:enamine deaminase RidA (YjgF/YER057c/UK114 family)|nr:translation initiation inhibitor [Opitutaceae bacterium]
MPDSLIPPPTSPFTRLSCPGPDALLALVENGVFVAPLGSTLTCLSANARPGETARQLLDRLGEAASRRRLEPVQATVFCDPAADRHLATDFLFPVTCLGRHDTPAGNVQSARICALAAGTFDRVRGAGSGICQGAGAVWQTPGARHLLLGALVPPDPAAPPDVQAAALWVILKNLLALNGFTLRDLVRTWFFNDRILDWYADFNRVRTAFFIAHDIFGTLVPASTGIGASNSADAALTLDALAISPLSPLPPRAPRVETRAVPSPLQCPANDYRSAFNRAVEIDAPDGRHLLVSGTASIEPGGRTAHTGDLDAQIDLSLRVVAAILESRGMAWTDVARAIAYFPDLSWMPRFEARRVALGLPPIPAILAHCDICRDDLLFEIELDAWKPQEVRGTPDRPSA